MKVPYGEGVATHTDPESCAGMSNHTGEALTGARTGQVLSRETWDPRERGISAADAVNGCGRQNRAYREREVRGGLGAVVDPAHVRKHFAREPGEPTAVCRQVGRPRQEPARGR